MSNECLGGKVTETGNRLRVAITMAPADKTTINTIPNGMNKLAINAKIVINTMPVKRSNGNGIDLGTSS